MNIGSSEPHWTSYRGKSLAQIGVESHGARRMRAALSRSSVCQWVCMLHIWSGLDMSDLLRRAKGYAMAQDRRWPMRSYGAVGMKGASPRFSDTSAFEYDSRKRLMRILGPLGRFRLVEIRTARRSRYLMLTPTD